MKIIIVLLFTYLFSSHAFALGAAGHEAVCQIAFEELKPKAKKAVLHIMSSEGDKRFQTFRDACVWPDYMGSQRARSKDHYINVPRNWFYIKYEKCVIGDTCLFTAIRQDVSVLKNKESSDKERLEALKFLGHWVGDIHQPLHVSFEDDRGGNDIHLSKGIGCKKNLHSVWDSCLFWDKMAENGFKKGAKNREAYALFLHKSITQSQRKRWRAAAEITTWADESLKIARQEAVQYCHMSDNNQCNYSKDEVTFAEGVEDDGAKILTLGDAYEDEFNDILTTRVKQAGVRLGSLLNSIFNE